VSGGGLWYQVARRLREAGYIQGGNVYHDMVIAGMIEHEDDLSIKKEMDDFENQMHMMMMVHHPEHYDDWALQQKVKRQSGLGLVEEYSGAEEPDVLQDFLDLGVVDIADAFIRDEMKKKGTLPGQ
jgi:hypothetical protein